MSPGDVFENWKRSTQAVVMPVELGLTSTDSGSIYFLRELVSVVETTVVVSSSTKRYIFLIGRFFALRFLSTISRHNVLGISFLPTENDQW